MKTLLKNSVAITLFPSSIETVDLRISNSLIVERGKNLLPQAGEKIFDLKGKIVLPGMVNAHTHLYSTLSRGMPMPKTPPRNFIEILKKIWWKLDRALDEETIYYSALVGAIEAVQNGTTTIIDHHASPNAINGSLEIIKEAMAKIGLRGVLCYEVTDRGGKKQRDEGIAENENFILKNYNNSFFRGLVGAHASFTLSEESLSLCGELASAYNTGVHIHVAEDLCDVVDAERKYHCGIVDRLSRNNILTNKSILGHCIHLSQKDYSRLNKTQTWFAHNPRSNMNNKVGYSPIHQFKNRGMIGTDGFPSDMIEEAKIAFFKRQDSQQKQKIDFSRIISGGQQYVSDMFGSQFGTLAKNSVADLVVSDYVAPTPMTKENILGHYLYGMRSANIESVIVGGKWVMKDRKVLGIDVERIYSEADKKSKKMWIKMMETVP
ncbi:MAG: putative aminohydrolase SsnA [Bacteroidota bacterium]|nr:putative aminohydrolase SsnA [Bacteroidota bacterium]